MPTTRRQTRSAVAATSPPPAGTGTRLFGILPAPKRAVTIEEMQRAIEEGRVIGLDTNLLVRVVTGDDPATAEAVRRFLDANCTPRDPGHVSVIVLCELSWVLTRRYSYTRAQIAHALEAIVTDPGLRIEDARAARSAVTRYRNGAADFADYLLGESNRAAGCATTVTLDRKAALEPDFTPLPAER